MPRDGDENETELHEEEHLEQATRATEMPRDGDENEHLEQAARATEVHEEGHLEQAEEYVEKEPVEEAEFLEKEPAELCFLAAILNSCAAAAPMGFCFLTSCAAAASNRLAMQTAAIERPRMIAWL